MTATVYTFHRAEDHTILATGNPVNLQDVARQVAQGITGPSDQTRRVYVHNGGAVVGADLCRQGAWTDTLRENYRGFDRAAKNVRKAEGFPVYEML